MVPEWSFPGRGRVQRQLTRASKAMSLAERVVGSLPIRGKRAEWMAALEEQHLLADRALGYVELYGAYTETEALYRVDRLLALWDRMDEDDRATFCLDPGGHRLGHLRPGDPPPLDHRARPGPDLAGQVDQDQPGRPGPEEHPLARPPPGRLRPGEHPDRLQRGRLLRLVGLTPPAAGRAGRRSWPTWWPRPRRCWPSTVVTGATSCAPSTGATRAPRPPGCTTTGGTCSTTCCWPSRSRRASPGSGPTRRSATGPSSSPAPSTSWSSRSVPCSTRSSAPSSAWRTASSPDGSRQLPPIGEARALVLADYAEAEGLKLEESMAYADSASDLPMLEAVGFPVAVNPEAKLAAIARRRGWHVETWHKAEGGSQPLLPLGPLDRRGAARRGRTSPAARAGQARRWRTARRRPDDEGAGARAQPAPVRRLPGGLAPRLGPGRGHRAPPAARRRGTRAPGRRLVSAAPAAVGHLRVRPGHPGRPRRRGTSRTWSASRSCPATRWSACSTTAASTPPAGQLAPGHPRRHRAGAGLRPAPHPPAVHRVRVGPHRPVRQPRLRAPSSRACRPATAPTPAAAGRPPR